MTAFLVRTAPSCQDVLQHPDFDLDHAVAGAFRLVPIHEMLALLERDSDAMAMMITRAVPPFADVRTAIGMTLTRQQRLSCRRRLVRNPADIHAIARQDPVYLSPVNVAEVGFGLELLRTGPQKQRAMAMLRRLRRKPQLRITLDTTETFGRLAAQKSGQRPTRAHQ
jgi:hypothetical protein